MTAYLPDDLEERWAARKAICADVSLPYAERAEALQTLSAWERRWRELAAAGALTWRQRRRLRQLLGGPLTPAGASGSQSVERDHEWRAWRIRIKKAYGADGLREIESLMDRLWWRRPAVPDAQARAWAEKTYRNERRL